MQKNHGVFWGIAVLLITAMFTAAGCNIAIGSDKNTDPSDPYNDPVDVTTDPVAVTGVSLDKTSLDLYMKTTTALTATVTPAGATNKALTWSTSNPAVATVAGGTVTPVSTGQATITVTTMDGGKTAACIVTVIDPVEINNLAELIAINSDPENLSKSYKLMADITGATPIGFQSGGLFIVFTGDFDGNGHTVTLNITNGLTISQGPLAGTYAGLFAAAGEMSVGTHRGTIHDLKVAGTINVSGANVYAGGVAGGIFPSAEIRNVSSSVDVTATSSGEVYAGGILGGSQGTVSNVYATGNVSATGSASVYVGGIAGASQGAVSNVYTTGNVSATTTGNTESVYAGGIVGTGSVTYAYVTGSVSAVATGTGPGDHSVTVGAGGIAGAASGDPVRYTVALNSAVSASGNNYNKCSFRITSTNTGTVTTNDAVNYGRANLTPSVSGSGDSSLTHTNDKGADQQDGVDVTVTGGPLPTAYTAPSETWWTGTGFSGADWTSVWRWDTATGLPKLR
jgi:hypothetical protein